MATAPLITRVPPEHRQKLLTPLSAAASAALSAMGGNKLLRPVMDEDTSAQLINAGYAKATLGGVALTDVGQVRAQMEIVQ